MACVILYMQHLPLSVLARHYSLMDMPKLTAEDVKRRVLTVCRDFEKIDADEVSHICIVCGCGYSSVFIQVFAAVFQHSLYK